MFDQVIHKMNSAGFICASCKTAFAKKPSGGICPHCRRGVVQAAAKIIAADSAPELNSSSLSSISETARRYSIVFVVIMILVFGSIALRDWTSNLTGYVLLGGLSILSLLVYFIPAFIDHDKKHHNALAITLLNLFLGWTFVGWVVALVWACTKPPRALNS